MAQTGYYKRIIITKIMIYLRDDNSFFCMKINIYYREEKYLFSCE